MGDKVYKYLVRLPIAMRDLLAESAEYHRRSINSEIVARLHLSFSGLAGVEEQRAIAPAMHEQFERLLHRDLSDDEERLIRRFRCLNSAKRDALLDLLS
ncbi:MAG: Arc family DNA-binding protein [Pseudomonadales bacterium]